MLKFILDFLLTLKTHDDSGQFLVTHDSFWSL